MSILPIGEIITENQIKEITSAENNTGNIDLAFFEYANTKSIKLRNEIAKRNQALVGFIINKYYAYKLDEKLSKEDLVQEGMIGLMAAIDGFKPELGFKFSTYSAWWIRQAINNYILNIEPMIHIPSHVRTANNKLIKRLKEENLIYKDYIENYSSLDNKLMYSIKCAAKTKNIISIDDTMRRTSRNTDKRNPFGSDSLLREMLTKDGVREADSTHDSATVVNVIKSALEDLPSKEKYILLLRFNIIDKIPKEIRDMKNEK